MASMGYCRFHNTLQDLRDCLDHIDDDDLSEGEQKAREQLIKLCDTVSFDYGEDR